MRRGQWAARLESLQLAADRGVFRAAQLSRLGVPSPTIYRRCRGSGPWRRVLPGIIMLSNGAPSSDQMIAAALAYGRPGAMITGLEACRRHGITRGLPVATTTVHILIPHTRQLRSTEFVHVERSERLPRPVVRNGVPLAPVPRACIDAARRLRAAPQVAELLADAVQRGRCDLANLRQELAACSRRGTAVPRAVLADVGAGIRSAAELAARRVWRRSRLPEPWWNARLRDEHGRLLGIADAWWDDVGLAWEIDSLAWHLSPGDYARTTERAARLAAAGILVVPTLPARLRDHPELVAEELRDAYRAAQARSRPSVRAVR